MNQWIVIFIAGKWTWITISKGSERSWLNCFKPEPSLMKLFRGFCVKAMNLKKKKRQQLWARKFVCETTWIHQFQEIKSNWNSFRFVLCYQAEGTNDDEYSSLLSEEINLTNSAWKSLKIFICQKFNFIIYRRKTRPLIMEKCNKNVYW